MDSPLPQHPRGANLGLGTPKRGVSVIQAANRLRNASGTPNRHNSTNINNLGPNAQVGTNGAPPVPALVIESQRFEEWMKIATDNVGQPRLNLPERQAHKVRPCSPSRLQTADLIMSHLQKITSTNTWNLALIDYFHEGSLLRNADDNSINFQKASCTLDGCVKIWTSRVDSVATETGKLLSGLAEDGRKCARRVGGPSQERVNAC